MVDYHYINFLVVLSVTLVGKNVLSESLGRLFKQLGLGNKYSK